MRIVYALASMPSSPSQPSVGAYFLANDVKIDWAYSFLASFRVTNPAMPLSLIPYDHRINKLRQLAARYRFDIVDPGLLDQYSALILPIAGKPDRYMHKLVGFEGAYDYFYYLDSDIIATSDLPPMARRAIENGVDFFYFDSDIRYVYAEGPVRDEMVRKYGAKGFNAGCWFSRRRPFSLERMSQLVGQAAPATLFIGQRPCAPRSRPPRRECRPHNPWPSDATMLRTNHAP